MSAPPCVCCGSGAIMRACCYRCGLPTGGCTCSTPRRCPSPTCFAPETGCDLGNLRHETCPTWRAVDALSLRGEIDELIAQAELVASGIDLIPGARPQLVSRADRLVGALRSHRSMLA